LPRCASAGESLPGQQLCRQQQAVGPAGQWDEAEMRVEGCGRLVLGIDDHPGDGQYSAGLNDLMAGVGEEKGSQSLPAKSSIHGEPADQGQRHGVAR